MCGLLVEQENLNRTHFSIILIKEKVCFAQIVQQIFILSFTKYVIKVLDSTRF